MANEITLQVQSINKDVDINELATKIKGYQITSKDDFAEVKDALVILKEKEKEIKAPITKAKKEAYEPYKQLQQEEKNIANDFKIIKDAISGIITPYNLKLEAEVRAKRIQLQEAMKSSKENGTRPPEINKKELEVDTSGLRKQTNYEVIVVDIDKVPRQYLKQEIDRAKVLEAHKVGLPIPGITVKQEATLK